MTIQVEPSGVVMLSECAVRTPLCTALAPAPITAVWALPGRVQINVCRACLEEMVREAQWAISGARVSKRHEVAASR